MAGRVQGQADFERDLLAFFRMVEDDMMAALSNAEPEELETVLATFFDKEIPHEAE